MDAKAQGRRLQGGMGVPQEALTLLQDKVGKHLRGRPGCPLRDAGGSPPLCPPRPWKVPSPKGFFQPLYVGYSGDFKVSAPPHLVASPLEPLSLCGSPPPPSHHDPQAQPAGAASPGAHLGPHISEV